MCSYIKSAANLNLSYASLETDPDALGSRPNAHSAITASVQQAGQCQFEEFKDHGFKSVPRLK